MKEQLQRAKQALEAEAPVAAEPAAGESGGAGGAGGAVASKAQQRAKKADDYHARHRGWVAEFNELTGGECAGGDGGVKWAAVRAWQQKHWQLNNLLADGLVGPKTLEAAKLLAKKNAPKAEKDGAAEGGEGKQKEAEAPEAGNAEAAEASADKPNLEQADVDEQLTPDVTSSAPQGAVAAKKQTTLADFETAVAKLEEVLAQTRQPQGAGAQKPIAQHYVEGTADTDAPPALGAMMKTEALKGYLEAANKLETSWTGLGQPHARAQFLLDAVNEALGAEQVPGIADVILARLPNPGEFVASQWAMKMNEPIFTPSSAPKNLGEVASQVFHEGRHAEQRFTIARLIASQKPHASPAVIARQAGVPEPIAHKAADLRTEPLSPAQAEKAEEFKNATVDNPAHKEIEQSAAAITAAANETAATFRAMSPEDQAIASARWQDLRQRAIAGLEAYYHLATERDAYAAQKQLAAANK